MHVRPNARRAWKISPYKRDAISHWSGLKLDFDVDPTPVAKAGDDGRMRKGALRARSEHKQANSQVGWRPWRT
jgi:hypothetical protein